MPRFIADLEIHSKYARAVSPQMTLENLALWGAKKGLSIISTGDCTHPAWFKEIEEKLEEAAPGLYRLKAKFRINREAPAAQPYFILGGEVSCIYTKNKKGRRVHHLIYLPNVECLRRFNHRLGLLGNLRSDGRPILGLDSKEILKLLLEISPAAALIPAHVWTPWFGVFGSMSGFNSLEECFDELETEIFAIETGLSSDPPMNWRIPFLDNRAIISGSDSHSLTRLGREATIFNFPGEPSYSEIMAALKTRDGRLAGTIEFFPEEGRYHYDGHHQCGIIWNPAETKKQDARCPKCGRKVTVGVLSRVAALADPARDENFKPAWAKPFQRFVPLDEIIGEALDLGKNTKGVWQEYEAGLKRFGPELKILTETPEAKLRAGWKPEIAEAISRMRAGQLTIKPGYDGEYGVIKIFTAGEREHFASQKSLF